MASNVKVGISVMQEKPYVLSSDSKIPLIEFMSDAITLGYGHILQWYSDFCRQRRINHDSSTAWPMFVEQVGKKKSFVDQRKMINLTIRLSKAIRSASNMAAQTIPAVGFVSVAYARENQHVQVKIRPTDVAVKAKVIQRKLKDHLMNSVIVDGRPVLDLGGGLRSMVDAASFLQLTLPSIESYDIRVGPKLTFKALDLSKYQGKQIIANHSSYHFSVPKWLEVVRKRPKGITLVLDTEASTFRFKGEDYEFKATRLDKYKNIEAYIVSGELFSIKTRDGSGRIFSDEIWYTRKQWARWGFNLTTDLAAGSDFVRRHVVLFTPLPEQVAMSYPVIKPTVLMLSQGSKSLMLTSKAPPIWEMFKEDRDVQLTGLYGMMIYQTPKLDGLNMILHVCNDRKVRLVDKLGVVYELMGTGGSLLVSKYVKFVASVELVSVPGTSNSFEIYINQIISGGLIKDDFYVQLRETVKAFNALFFLQGSMRVLGLKDYYRTRNSILKFSSSLPHDGVFYIPSLAVAGTNYLMSQGFIKLFSGSDVDPYVLSADTLLSKVRGMNYKIFYRYDQSTILKEVPFSQQVQTLFRCSLLNANDFYGDSNISPLLYEGYFLPAGYLVEEDAFVVTHVRGDKRRKDFKVKRTTNLDWIEQGTYALTKFGDTSQELVRYFFLNLSSSRIMKLTPAHFGVSSNLVISFLTNWYNNSGPYDFTRINTKRLNNIYSSTVEDLLKFLRELLQYHVALLFLDTLFRYAHVKRFFTVEGRRIVSWVEIDLSKNYKDYEFDETRDAFGAKV